MVQFGQLITMEVTWANTLHLSGKATESRSVETKQQNTRLKTSVVETNRISINLNGVCNFYTVI